MSKDVSVHRYLYLQANGPGPWECYFCDEPITESGGLGARNLLVHHLDGDHSNHVLENLVGCHWGCHSRETASNFSSETRRKISVANTGKKHTEATKALLREKRRISSPEYRAKISAALQGRECPTEVRAKISATLKDRWSDPDFRAEHSEAILAAMTPEANARRSATMKKQYADGTRTALWLNKDRPPQPLLTCDKCGGSYVGKAGLALHRKGKRCRQPS